MAKVVLEAYPGGQALGGAITALLKSKKRQ